MKELFIFIFIQILFIPPSFAFEDITLPQEGYEASYNAQIEEKISNEAFCDIEKKIFKKTFSSDSASKRMSRLEKELFGMEQKGDIDDRFDNIITASQYYQEGYRAGKSSDYIKNEARPKYSYDKLDSWNYIQDYDLPERYEDYSAKNNYNTPSVNTKNTERYYYDDNENNKTSQKGSKIKQFFTNLADILSAGVVTGYTPPLTGNYGIDSFSTNFGGAGYIGLPQFPTFVYTPGRNYYNSYSPSQKYRNLPHSHRQPPPHRYIPPPHNNNYTNPHYYGTGVKNYNSGAGIKIIYWYLLILKFQQNIISL